MTWTAGSLRPAAIAPILLLGLLSVDAGEAAAAIRCRPPLEPWTQVELYFGRSLGGDAVVSEEAFQHFLAKDVTPLFPDGLSVVDVAGQFRATAEPRGAIRMIPSVRLAMRSMPFRKNRRRPHTPGLHEGELYPPHFRNGQP